MSIRPKSEQENLQPTILQKTQYAVKKTLSVYFEDPIYYLFYGSLTAMVIGLFFNKQFPLQFYIVISILGAIKAYSFFYKKS